MTVWNSLRSSPLASSDSRTHIVIATSYKAGTTWMQSIVANLLFRGNDFPAPVGEMSPWLDMRLTPLELVITSNNGQSEDAISDGLAPATFMLDLEPWFSGTDSLLVADLLNNADAIVHMKRIRADHPVSVLNRAHADLLHIGQRFLDCH